MRSFENASIHRRGTAARFLGAPIRICRRPPFVAALAVWVVGAGASSASAATWYVQAGASAGGNGSSGAPFSSLEDVQSAAGPGDTIIIDPAPVGVAPLNGGIALKPGQSLEGGGPAVAGNTGNLQALPAVTNTTASQLSGDAVRLADNTTVENLVIPGAHRGAIYGLDSVGVRVLGNDVSNQNTSCTKGFLVQPFNVPTGIPFVAVPASPAVAPQNGWAGIMVDGSTATGTIDVEDNYVHDAACGDGIDIRAMGSSSFTATVTGNTVTKLAQGSSLSSVLAIGMQALDSGYLHVGQDRNTETYIGSPGADCEGEFANTAASGVVIDNVENNTFAHGIGGTSCNGFETIISKGNGTIAVDLRNSTFTDNNGDAFEEGNLGSGSTMRFLADHVVVDGTTVRGGNPPLSSDGGTNPIPFNIGDCMVLGDDGANDSTTFVMTNSVFEGCNNGISAGNNAGLGNGVGLPEALVVNIDHSVITHNAKYGLHVYNGTPINMLHVSVANTAITSNGERGASVEAAPEGVAEDPKIDFGGGSLASPGGNCLYGNAGGDLESTNFAITADHDWWGHPGPPRAGQVVTHETGSISTDDGLAEQPACGVQ